MNEYLYNFIKDLPTGSSLDLGQGRGFDVACLKSLSWDAHGVDKKMGVDLNEPFVSDFAPYDLVYSNYVLHFIKNKGVFVQTISNNLKITGRFFVHTFHNTDRVVGKQGISERQAAEIFRDFVNVKIKIITHYDNDEGHKHWHRILQITGHKSAT